MYRRSARYLAAAVAALALTACSGGGDNSETGQASAPTEAPASTTSLAPTDFTVPQTSVVEVDPIVELPTDERIELGAVESVRQELSEACAAAVEPIRELMVEHTTGVGLPDAARTTLNDGLAAGRGACGADEWADFQALELHGWMYAAG